MKALLLDLYVDEPACFGVPPFLSPYPRYIAGALVDGGAAEGDIAYMTIDRLRERGFDPGGDYEAVFITGGYTVPGRYLGGKIGTIAELTEFLRINAPLMRKTRFLIGGPFKYARHDLLEGLRNLRGEIVRGDIERFAYRLMREPGLPSENFTERRTYAEVDRWAVRGAFITQTHPNYPNLILEMESYRGCTRDVYCSFCSEAFYGRPDFREINGIIEEFRTLYTLGNRHFRLGRQADLISYLPHMNECRRSFPRPNPESLLHLYSGIREAAPEIETLHLDNINPGIIAIYPEESSRIISIIAQYNTPGDTAALGIESVDPAVIALNDLKCDEEEAYRAVSIINELGGMRRDGMPALLPGINLIQGLTGETDKTFEKNLLFLRRIKEAGLLLRRINIRQVSVHPKTKLERLISGEMSEEKRKIFETLSRKRMRPDALRRRFEYYRDLIRTEIDRPMIEAIYPAGTRITRVIPESLQAGFILGRPLGSYPPTIKIPSGDAEALSHYNVHRPIDVIVTGARERSITALSWPIHPTGLDRKALETIPGIGKSRAASLAEMREPTGEEILRAIEGRAVLKKSDFIC